MSDPLCVRGDFVIELRSLIETPGSINCSYWIREVGGSFCGGPFETLPDATCAALDLSRRAGTSVWRECTIFLEGGAQSALQLVTPPNATRDDGKTVVRDCA